MILFIGQVASEPARPRGVPGGRLPADVRPRHARLRQVGRRGARRRPPARVRRARLPHRDAGPARPGRARAARGHAGDGDRGAGAAARRARAGRAGARGAGASCATLLLAAERPFVIAGGSGWTRERVRRAERFAERWQLPVGCAFRFQDVFDNRHPNYAGDVGIGINPKLAARVREADLVARDRPAPRRDDDRRLHAARAAAAAPEAGPHPRRRRGARPRLCGRPADAVRRWPARRRRWRRSTPPADAPLGRRGPRAAHADYEANLVPTPVAPLDMAEVVQTIAAPRCPPTRSSPTAPATSAAGCTASTAIAGCATPAARQLAPTSGAMGYGAAGRGRRGAAGAATAPSSTSPATATS